MGWPVCNSTLEDETIIEDPLWEGGMTFHRIGLYICGGFALFAISISLILIMCHATHYSKPREQRHIIRILLMIPIYSAVAFLSFLYYRQAVYFEVLGDCYEAFTISSFFALLCHYIAPDLHSQKEYFRGIRPKPWLWPLNWLQKVWGGENGIWRTPRSGLTWFNIIWTGIFQYCLIRVLMTIVAVATQTVGLYCEESLSPAFSHIWVLVLESICVSIAMYCLVQFYIQIRQDVKQYQVFTKILSIKLVIFLSFWQTTLISFLTSSGALKPTRLVQSQDLKIGIPNLLICIEMAIFAVMHLWAFKWQPYRLDSLNASNDPEFYGGKARYHGGFMGIKALIDAFNPWDLMKAIGRGLRWLFVGRKTRMLDPSYQNDPSSFGMKPTDASAPETSFPGPNVTAYKGPGVGRAGSGRSDFYGGSSPEDEGEELLPNAQPQPQSYIPHGEIGVAMSSYDEEHPLRTHSNSLSYSVTDSPVDSRSHSPLPFHPYQAYHSPYHNPSTAAEDGRQGNQRFYNSYNQQAGTTNAYQHSGLSHQEEIPMPMPAPYLPPPLDDYHNQPR
ncbi:hypothetical protein DTO271G3_141 [Paecilomyces variotii]|nr:hypothetical protein DTO271G3_141 [Paecilomyces variotii]